MPGRARQLGLVCTLVAAACAAVAGPGSASAGRAGGTAETATGDWIARVERGLAQREYRATKGRGGLQAPNRAHGLRTWFEPTRIRVHDRTAPEGPRLLALGLAGVGRGARPAAPDAGVVSSQGARVEIRRGSILEWYENSPDGLEQGFTLAERPAGAGPLVIELAATDASASLRGDAVVFATPGGRRLRYGDLRAWDASGAALAARLAVVGPGRVRLEVEDAGARYPIVVDPLLAGTFDMQLASDQTGSQLGASVAGAGDVNGDGHADAIVGAPLYDAGDTDEGAAFVFLGGAGGIADADPATAHAQLESDQAGARLGASVAGAGDVNGDGYADLIVGAPLYDAGETDEGAAFVFLGGAGGIADADPDTAHARLESDQAGAQLGASVAGAGDVNGGGHGDVIVGAPLYDAGEMEEGAAFLFLGSAGGIADAGPATAHARLESDQAGAGLGRSVAGAGDVNGDTFADVIAGAPFYQDGELGEGAALVFLGGPAGIANGDPDTAHAQLESDLGLAQLGFAVAGAGDVNGDGFADVIVGAPLYDAPESDEGAAFVFLGSLAGIADANPAAAHAQLESDQPGAFLGWSVAGGFDANGDGHADVVAGAPFYDGGQTDEGAAFVFAGGMAGIADADPSGALARLESDEPGARLGHGVAGIGDADGDGFAEVIAGAPSHDARAADAGAAFVSRGGAESIVGGDADAAHTRLTGDSWTGLSFLNFGWSAAGAGDVNGDGYADVIVGMPGFDGGEAGEGAAFVFLGGPFGIADGGQGTAHAQLESDQMAASFGRSVAGAGDVNGDGYGDVIVGARGYDAGHSNEGAVFVFLGSATGIPDGDPGTAHARIEANQASAFLGDRVAGAGDVNGDGYADVILGASSYDLDASRTGAAFVFHGSASGITATDLDGADTRLEADAVGGGFGADAAGAGDVNGDGYADVIAGAPGYDAGEANEGAAFVFLGGPLGIASGDAGTAHARLESDQEEALLGLGVAGAGDVNGDGYADVMAGAAYYEAPFFNEGVAFVFLGSAGGVVGRDPDTAHARLDSDESAFELYVPLFGETLAGLGDVNGDGYGDIVVGAYGSNIGEGAAFVYLGSAAGIASGGPEVASAEIRSGQPGDTILPGAVLGHAVAGAGDVNGDGYADLIVTSPNYSALDIWDGAAFVFLGNGNRTGQPVVPQQLRGDASGVPVQPWGSSLAADAFRVELTAVHPDGAGRVKLEVEACPSGVAFGQPGCVSHVGSAWTPVPPGYPFGARLGETVSGLAPGTLYRWRARVQRAPLTGPAPPAPPHGPWRPVHAHGAQAGLRTVPEPGGIAALLAGTAAVLALGRRRASAVFPLPPPR